MSDYKKRRARQEQGKQQGKQQGQGQGKGKGEKRPIIERQSDILEFHEEWLQGKDDKNKDEIVLAAVLGQGGVGPRLLLDYHLFHTIDRKECSNKERPLKLCLPTGEINLSSLHLGAEDDVDNFFDHYPECAVQYSKTNSYESDEEPEPLKPQHQQEAVGRHHHNGDQLQVLEQPTKRPPSVTAQAKSNNNTNNNNNNNNNTKNNTITTNPYHAADHHIPHRKTNQNNYRQHPQSVTHSKGPSWDELEDRRQQKRPPAPQFSSYNPPSNPYDHQNQQQQPFAFQSARQLHESGGGAADDDDPRNQDPYSQQQRQHQQYQQPQQRQFQQTTIESNNNNIMNNNNPYARKSATGAVQKTNIPNSLKRKFQPPKRSENNGAPRKTSNNANGTTTTTRGQQSNGGTDEDDDNDLPEELKGLDKELIEKIQNEIMESGETITFHDIAGLDDAKQTVQELVCWPMKRPDLFTGLRRGPNGLLLFGPPGTGKTLIGKAIAHESGATFFSISSSSLTSKWIGEGEKLVRTLFAVASYREPAVVFIDEIDSLLTQRKADENEASRRIKTEFLVQLDGTGSSSGRVLCIGATNRPHELDDAARRRFVKRLYIPLPAQRDRETLLRTLLGANKNKLSERDFQKLSVETEGFSGADLKALCVEAAMGPLRALGSKALEVEADAVPPISAKHFKQALRGVNPSVAQADLNIYIEWNKTYGSTRSANYDDDDDDDDDDDSDGDVQTKE